MSIHLAASPLYFAAALFVFGYPKNQLESYQNCASILNTVIYDR